MEGSWFHNHFVAVSEPNNPLHNLWKHSRAAAAEFTSQSMPAAVIDEAAPASAESIENGEFEYEFSQEWVTRLLNGNRRRQGTVRFAP